MKTKTVVSAVLSAVFLGAMAGVGIVHKQKEDSKEFAARQKDFMDCFATAKETDYPSRATPEERTQAQKKAEAIAKTVYASMGIPLTEQRIKTVSTHLVDSEIVIRHCAAKTGVETEVRWYSGDQLSPTLR